DHSGQLLTTFKRLKTILLDARDQLEFVDIVGPAEAHLFLAVGSNLQAIHGKIKVATLQPRNQVLEIVLLKSDRPIQFAGQGVDEVHFKANVPFEIVSVFKNVRRSPFCVRSPEELPASRFLRQGEWKKKGEQEKDRARDRRAEAPDLTATRRATPK